MYLEDWDLCILPTDAEKSVIILLNIFWTGSLCKTMTVMDNNTANEETRRAWEENAAFWDAKMGEGNDFANLLCWPAVRALLDPQAGQRLLAPRLRLTR
jgi:hypothetical protein